MCFFISKTEISSDLLPLLAVISLGFIRLLPAIQQIYTHISRIKTLPLRLLMNAYLKAIMSLLVKKISIFLEN